MEKKLKEEDILNIIGNKSELFLNEYNWDSIKDENHYFFKIRLNTNSTILFSCSTSESTKQKFFFENNYSLKDLHYFERFKKIENINDIYIYLLTIIQEKNYEYEEIEEKEEKKLKLIIKPYTTSEKSFEFLLSKKLNDCRKCEICDRIHSGINYLRFMRDNNLSHNIMNSNNNLYYHINCNYNNINNTTNSGNNIISKILDEINLLKKENSMKNEQIKNLQKDLYEQNARFSKENSYLKEQLSLISKEKPKEEIKPKEEKEEKQPKNEKEETKSEEEKEEKQPQKEMPDIASPFVKDISETKIKSKTSRPIKLMLKTFKASNKIFNKDPNELKFHSQIVNNLSSKGVNDIFEVYTSNVDNQDYLVSKNGTNNFLDIINLNNNQIVTSLKGHTNTITMVRYFINYKGKNEYLISADTNKNVIVWDITNNFKLLHFIQTEYINHNIYSCYIFFDNWDNNYIFTSCGLNRYEKNEASYTRMYSLKDGKFEKDIIDSNENNTYYLLIWYHEGYKINYLIECCEEKIIITDFVKNDLYANLMPQGFKVLKYYSGFIYNYEKKNGRDFLCCSTSNGCVAIWDLLNINLIYFGKISKFELYNIIQWNENYALISGGANKTIKIFDLKKFKEVNNIETGHSSNVNCIKKIIHPIFGESLLTSGNDHKIKLWTIND